MTRITRVGWTVSNVQCGNLTAQNRYVATPWPNAHDAWRQMTDQLASQVPVHLLAQPYPHFSSQLAYVGLVPDLRRSDTSCFGVRCMAGTPSASPSTYPPVQRILFRGDERLETYRADVVLRGDPEAVVIAADVQELREVLAYCHQEKKPVTFCGNRTSLTGAPVAENGLLVATERLNRLLDIDEQRGIAVAEPGIVLAEFQDQLSDRGLFYPPDPTSRKEALLGATVATNANGEDSLQYGSTRCHIRALKVLLADGRMHSYERSGRFAPGREKNRAGYLLDGEPLDWFIGSEGTLGLITEVTVDLVRHPARHFSGIAFFSSLQSAIRFVVASMSGSAVAPRALELMDENCLAILRGHPRCFPIPSKAKAALYFKQEFVTEAKYSATLDRWLQLLERHYKRSERSLVDGAFIAADRGRLDLLRDLRHHIPATINEETRKYREMGGGKVSTDWWVPLHHLERAMQEAVTEAEQLGLPMYVFGHIGNGHPHINVIPRNGSEKTAAQAAVLRQCQRASAWGGSVAGEHGIGKIKRHLLTVQHTQRDVERMIALKRSLDPHWILGRNTLFPYAG